MNTHSGREVRPSTRYSSNEYILLTDGGEPESFEEAITSEHKDMWMEAMQEEMQSLHDNETFELVKLPKGKKALKNKWVFRLKHEEHSSQPRFKARIVVKGFGQKHGVDFDEIFSSVVKMTSIRIVLGLAAELDLEVEQMDVKTAFLHGDLEEEIYMEQPKGFAEKGKEDITCRLNKSLYGLKQAPRQWYKKFESVITQQGFKKTTADHCVFVKDTSDDDLMVLLLYVDDMLIVGKDASEIKGLKKQLSKIFSMKDLGPAKRIIGMEIHRDRYAKKTWLLQEKYIEKVKIEHQRPAGTLLSLPIPQWKWEHITMDFVTGLPRVRRGFNSIWVIVDRLTKSAHFLPVKTTYSMNQYAEDYIAEIVRLHGVPVSIVSDRDPRFTSEFWKSLHRAMGSRLAFSTAYHPQSDGQSERVIQILEDMLRACTIDFPGSWDSLLPLAEFTYNNSYQATIGMAPYEALYGRKCRSPLYWDEVGERKMLGPELVQQTADVVAVIRERMKTAQSRQKSYADVRRRPLQFEIGDHVFLKIAPLKGVMRFGKKGKLSPRFIGPFEILDRVGDRAYRLALPPDLDRVHNVFHVSMLRKYVTDPSHVLRHEPLDLTPNLTYQEIPIQILDRTVRVLRNKEIGIVKVLWRNHLLEEATWEPEDEMREKYPELFVP
ncbi:uncharacterized protein [Primulina eburnea]|uniref:uncharacterized protein n=1 Tax=Primulina eburnea TaxID=1245227 RepID=UPI003C6C277C